MCQNCRQMTRRYWIVIAVGLSACSAPPPRDPGTLLPETVGDTWHRQTLQSLPVSQVGIERAMQASYSGSGNLTVDLYAAKVQVTAFEMTQHWRPLPDSVFFDKGRYFVVVKWDRADRQALTGFVRELQRHLGRLQ
jgi:hypothetical protein